MEWETVIGLEVHVQLATHSKIFSGAATQYGAAPNTQACGYDIALPGVLPVLNKQAVIMAIKFGLAIEAPLNSPSVFARKNYFYPDLPKGYQISQYQLPIVGNGILVIQHNDTSKTIHITRAHLEEDAGKSVHQEFPGMTGIDLNRAGIPLLEIVSEPDLRSASEAVAYLKTLHNLVVSLEICDGNMQEGSFRCDANVSVRPKQQQTLGTRTEIKNLNSFRFVEKAIQYEIARQIDILENHGTITQETRLYDSDKNCTRVMRSKEEAHDYRYFPDPDLLPLILDETLIADIRNTLPELPQQRQQRYQQQYELSPAIASQLANDNSLARYFEATLAENKLSPKLVANWLTGEITAYLNKDNLEISNIPISSAQLAELLTHVENNILTGKNAKTILHALWYQQGDLKRLIEQYRASAMTDLSALENIIAELIANHPQQFTELKAGKDKLRGFFVGKVMQATKNAANPQQINQLIDKYLTES